VIYPGADSPVADLFPHKAGGYITPESEAASQRFMAEVNRAHAATREGDRRLEGRIRSYELAARMQLAAPEALNLKAEPEHVLKLYGLDRGPQNWPKEINDEEETFYFAQKCLAARRLLERGVRFVQVWSGNDNGFPRRNWDSHESYGESDEWGYKPLDRKNPTEVPRHAATSARDRSRKTEFLSQRHQTPPDRRARTCHRAAACLTFTSCIFERDIGPLLLSILRTIRHLHIDIASEKLIKHLFEALLLRVGHFRSAYPPDVIILLICRALKVCAHQISVLERRPDEFRHRVTRSFQAHGFLWNELVLEGR
jgi:Protein of unknown function (DUF1501)